MIRVFRIGYSGTIAKKIKKRRKAAEPKARIVRKKLGRSNAYGFCYQYTGRIEIDPRQSSRRMLNTLLHELLHLYFKDASETKVNRTARKMTAVLWEQGFRQIKK